MKRVALVELNYVFCSVNKKLSLMTNNDSTHVRVSRVPPEGARAP